MQNDPMRIQYARIINYRIATLCYHAGNAALCPTEIRQDPLNAAKWLLEELQKLAAKNPSTELTHELRRVKDIITFYEGEN